MKQFSIHIILFFTCSFTVVRGQISPGDLSQAHADLEGMGNCTLCHDLGNKVSNTKCLDCHEVIQSLMDRKRGYHASREVRAKDCFDCHSEHHGRKFDATRFDQDNFNHDLTGYKLEGEHDAIDCRKCHVAENIHDREIRQRENTFLGLDEKCLSCHDDFHQKTLDNDCIQCHDFNTFRPAPKFDHDDSNYPLKGKHIDVDCVKCHEQTTRNGKDFQVFTDLAFGDCIDCHDDPHNNQLAGKCSQCHTESSFYTFAGEDRFNHNRNTKFNLNGAHKRLDCVSCHAEDSNPLTVFQDRKGITESQCATCHEDVHEGKFGNDCAKCHKESSFLSLRSMDFFDHSVTDYPLEGKHIGVDCKECHIERFLDAIDFSACKNCHDDYHRGQFEKVNSSPDCVDCHSLNEGFGYSLYTLEQHQQSDFPLEGAHLATPCFSCHVSEDRWEFRDIGSYCIDCHQDVHEDVISEKYYPENDCVRCHNSESWASIDFDHNLTEWPLVGKHQEVSCRECHFDMEQGSNDTPVQIFNLLDNQCITCHENIHGDQFAINGVTDCIRCHDSFSWFPNQFDHNTTAFPLDGAHAEVDCRACHIPQIQDGKIVTDFKIESFECIDCHQ